MEVVPVLCRFEVVVVIRVRAEAWQSRHVAIGQGSASDEAQWEPRLRYLVKEINDFLAEVGEFRATPKRVTAVPVMPIRDRNRRVTYTMRVDGEPFPEAWVEQVRDMISRARSLLDNAMWTAAHRDPSVIYNSDQSRRIYFPVAKNASDWAAFEKTAHGASLTSAVRTALRGIQPFVTGAFTVTLLSKSNNDDKHKLPLSLQMMPDRLFVFYPDVDFGKRGRGKTNFALSAPLLPIGNRILGEFTSEYPIARARSFDVPTALCISIGQDWVDVQDFLWDVLEMVVRATAILSDGDTSLADGVKRYIRQQRAQLDAFRKIFDGDVVAQALWEASSFGLGAAEHVTLEGALEARKRPKKR